MCVIPENPLFLNPVLPKTSVKAERAAPKRQSPSNSIRSRIFCYPTKKKGEKRGGKHLRRLYEAAFLINGKSILGERRNTEENCRNDWVRRRYACV